MGRHEGSVALAGTLSLVREQKERIRVIVEQRKQLGFPVPDGCEAWWSEYEIHGSRAAGVVAGDTGVGFGLVVSPITEPDCRLRYTPGRAGRAGTCTAGGA